MTWLCLCWRWARLRGYHPQGREEVRQGKWVCYVVSLGGPGVWQGSQPGWTRSVHLSTSRFLICPMWVIFKASYSDFPWFVHSSHGHPTPWPQVLGCLGEVSLPQLATHLPPVDLEHHGRWLRPCARGEPQSASRLPPTTRHTPPRQTWCLWLLHFSKS